MSIHLRIVGIFYSADVTVNTPNPTVKTVLDAAVSTPSRGTKFSYANTQIHGVNSPSVFQAEYQNGFDSTTSGLHYPPGVYLLTENPFTVPTYTVWQYYIIRNGVQVNKGGIIPYDSPDAAVQDGDSVIWRLVSIVAQPVPQPSTRYQRALLDKTYSAK